MGRIVRPSAVLAAFVAALAAPGMASAGREEIPVNVAVTCAPEAIPGVYCSQPFSTAVTTAGWLQFRTAVSPLPRDDARCDALQFSFSVDGGAWTGTGGNTAVPIGPGAVARGRHTIEVRARRPGGPCRTLQSWGGTLLVQVSRPEVAVLDLNFRDRIAAVTAAVRQRARQIGERKDELDRLIEKAQDRMYAAARRWRAHEAQLFELLRYEGRVRQALRQLRAATGAPSERARGLQQGQAAVLANVAALERQIVDATRRGRDVGALPSRLRRERAALADLDADIVRASGGSPELKRWFAELGRLRNQQHELRVGEAMAEHEREEAEAEAKQLLDERALLDREATAGAMRLAMHDFDISTIEVREGGNPVYRAEGSSELYDRLRELDENIALAEQALREIEPVRRQAKNLFYGAQGQAIAAEARLADRLMSLAYTRYFVDVGFAALDVGIGFVRGGPIGAISEGAKKAFEIKVLQEVLPDPSGIDPNSIEAEINAEYRAGLKQTLSAERIVKAGSDRLISDTALRAGRDGLNKVLAKLYFGAAGHSLKNLAEAADVRNLPTPSTLRGFLRAKRTFGHIDSQIKRLQQGGRYSFRSFGESFLKDIGKTGVKAALDAVEHEAWRKFFEADLIARARYPLFKKVSSLYWEAYDARQGYLAEQTRLLNAGIEPESGFKKLVQESASPDAQLEIALGVVSTSRDPISLTVLLGGARADFVGRSADGTLSYRLAASAITSQDGNLTLEVR